MRLRRSVLTTPGSDREKMEKAAESDADQVMLDLEDAVSDSQKSAARSAVVDVIESADWSGKRLSIRMNGIGTEHAYKDLIEIMEAVSDAIDSIVVPKVTDAFDVAAVGNLLSQIERAENLQSTGLEPLVEEVEAVQHIDDIAAASDRVEALVYGPGDYSASQGMNLTAYGGVDDDREYPGDIWHYIRYRLAIAARANDAVPIDGSYPKFEDTDGFRRECRHARTLGFEGKWAVHPNQIAIANEVFRPTEEEIQRAKEILAVVDQAAAEGTGAVQLDGEVQDEATARVARKTLERAETTGMLD